MARKPTIAEQRYTVGINPDLSLKVTDDEHMLPPGARTRFIVMLPAGHTALRRWANLMRGLGHIVSVDTVNLFQDYSNRQS